MTVTNDMTIAQVLEVDPGISNILVENGMHCFGCMMASGETIGEAASVHGIDPIALMNSINTYLASKQ